jgi:nucleoside-diphosphate-sugar epimerase
MKKKILICGATGFIGRNMLEHFIKNDNFDIRATWYKDANPTESYNGQVEWVHANLTKVEDVKKAVDGVDIILQYAAVTTGVKDVVNRPYIHVTDNAVMNSLLLREAFEQKVKHFIFPSCTVMYQSGDVPVKESDFDESEELYSKYYGGGNTKVYIEKMCKFYSTLGETKFTVLRQSNIYGPYDKFSLEVGHVFAATIVKVAQANGSIDVWGTGKEERDLLYVSDLVNSVQSIIENQTSKFELVNVGCGKSISVSDLVKKIVDVSGKKISINYDKDKPSVDTKLAVNIDKIKRMFNWSPDITLETGIKNTLKWYRENKV